MKKILVSSIVSASLGITVAMGASPKAMANPVTFTGSTGALSASATFDAVGSILLVRLTNTGLSDVLTPAQVLAAVFFDIPGAGALGRVSAILGPGSVVYYDPDGQPVGGDVGGEWAYKAALSGLPLGATEGISSAGFGLFGAGDLFPGIDLQPPSSPNGIQYGLLSAGDNVATGNGSITGSGGLIKNSVFFALSGLPAGFDPSAQGAITNVSFQYDASLTGPNIPGVRPPPPPPSAPEPATIALLGLGLGGLLLRRRGRKDRIGA